MMDFRKIGCEDGRWMGLVQNHAQWRNSAIVVSNPRDYCHPFYGFIFPLFLLINM